MGTLLFAAVLAVIPADLAEIPAVSDPASIASESPIIPFRTGRELSLAASDALRRWARPEDHQLELAAKELLVLFQELQVDAELALSLREPLLGKVRGRLEELARRLRVQAAVQRRLARENRNAPIEAVDNALPLAQLGGMGAQPGMGGNAWGQGGGLLGLRQDDDNGEQLVDLIQTTIRPGSWERNGGPGTIYYWRNQRAIVVRQMGDVHDDIGNLLQQMNRLGR